MTPLMRNTRSGWIHLGLFAVLTGLTAIGCSASVPKGKITGTVTYEGKPLESGVISFMPAKTGLSVSAEITNGQYTASEVPQGELYVTVVSVKQAGMTEADIKAEIERKEAIRKKMEMTGKEGDVPAQTRPDYGRQRVQARPESLIPSKYADPSRSELKFTLSSSEATYNVELQSDPNEPKGRPGRTPGRGERSSPPASQ
jgi:hypothetical protein